DDGLLDLGAREPRGGVGEAREVLSGGRPSVESLAGRLDSVNPRRVVSLCPSITETLVAIGGLSRPVAATRYSLRPPGLLWRRARVLRRPRRSSQRSRGSGLLALSSTRTGSGGIRG